MNNVTRTRSHIWGVELPQLPPDVPSPKKAFASAADAAAGALSRVDRALAKVRLGKRKKRIERWGINTKKAKKEAARRARLRELERIALEPRTDELEAIRALERMANMADHVEEEEETGSGKWSPRVKGPQPGGGGAAAPLGKR